MEPLSNVGVVIAHFDPHGRLARYLIDLVAALQRAGARIVFVSTGLTPAAAQALSTLAEVSIRENIGYDFWSYKLGLDLLGNPQGYQRILLLNSSFLVLEPERLIAQFLAATGKADLLGLTYSRERQLHLQSYWVCFDGPAILASDAFAQWWREMAPINERQQVIDTYELRMTEFFAARGFSIGSVFAPGRAEKLVASCRAVELGYLRPDPGKQGPVSLDIDMSEALNPTHFFWDALLQRLGIVKWELLKANPHGINTVRLLRHLHSQDRYRLLLEDALASQAPDADTPGA